MIMSLFGVLVVAFIYLLIMLLIAIDGFNIIIAVIGLVGIVFGVVMTLFGISKITEEKE